MVSTQEELPVPDYERLAEEAKVALAANELERGIALLTQAAEEAAAARDFAVQARLLNRLALVQKRDGHFDDAHATLLRTIDLLKQLDLPTELATAWNNLGFIERDLGLVGTAQQRFAFAHESFRAAGDELGMARALVNTGLIQKDRGELTTARLTFESALALLEGKDEPEDFANAFTGLGLTFEMLHDLGRSREYYLQALSSYRLAANRENEALVLHNLGQLCAYEKKYQEAVGYFQQAYEINRAVGAKLGQAEDLSSLAGIYQEMDLPEQAREIQEQALLLQDAMGYRRGMVWTLIDLGLLALHANDFDEAERRATDALRLVTDLGDPYQTYEVLLTRGQIHERKGHHAEALADYTAAVETVEKVRTNLIGENEALGYFDEPHLIAYERIVAIYAESLDDSTAAMLWLERAKAREFLRRLRFGELAHPHGVPRELLSEEEGALQRLRKVSTLLSEAAGAQGHDLMQNYDRALESLRLLWRQMESYDREYVGLRLGVPASWQELQKCLRSV
jgi:tetratricopeptide (TPR) repeat protein